MTDAAYQNEKTLKSTQDATGHAHVFDRRSGTTEGTQVATEDDAIPQRVSKEVAGDDVNRQDVRGDKEEPVPFKASRQFWLIAAALCATLFLSALDTTCVAVAIPTITSDLTGNQNSTWIGAAYTLTSTALLPWIGSIANIFGRTVTLNASIAIFCVGSLVSALSKSMQTMIAGRAVAGIGGGGIMTLVYIVICDIVPLSQRGPYFSILSAVWAVASCAGPPLSGALTTAGQWRWIFYMNLPIAGVAFVMIAFFLRIKNVERTFKEKMALMDWFNILFMFAMTSIIIGFTWAGEMYPWKSVQVIVPILVGALGVIVYVIIEFQEKNESLPAFFRIKNPSVPRSILSSRTTVLAHLTSFINSISLIGVDYYRSPVYFQGARVNSALMSGIYVLPMVGVIAPSAMASGIIISKQQKYKVVLLVGWAFITLGMGLLTLCKENSPASLWLPLPLVVGVGFGIILASTSFPAQAPLKDVSLQPASVAFRQFAVSFGQVIGVSIYGSAAQTQLRQKLPSQLLDQFPAGQSITFAAVAVIHDLPEGSVRDSFRKAFADSFIVLCYITMALGAFGLFLTFFIKDYALVRTANTEWGMEENKQHKKEIEEDQA